MARILVDVQGQLHGRGSIIVGLYTEGGFRRFGGDPPVASAKAKAGKVDTLVGLEDIPAGTYAAAAYHDENDNGRLDLTSVGVPAEGRGYSNTSQVALSVPSFADASFEHGQQETRVTVHLAYLGRNRR